MLKASEALNLRNENQKEGDDSVARYVEFHVADILALVRQEAYGGYTGAVYSLERPKYFNPKQDKLKEALLDLGYTVEWPFGGEEIIVSWNEPNYTKEEGEKPC